MLYYASFLINVKQTLMIRRPILNSLSVELSSLLYILLEIPSSNDPCQKILSSIANITSSDLKYSITIIRRTNPIIVYIYLEVLNVVMSNPPNHPKGRGKNNYQPNLFIFLTRFKILNKLWFYKSFRINQF